MKSCFLTIVTTTDGISSTVNKNGEMEFSDSVSMVRYYDENAIVSVIFEENTARLLREGDYTLDIPLKEGSPTIGKLGFGENVGQIDVYCKKLSYAVKGRSILASIHYILDFGNEKQEMQIRITAREKKAEEK